MQRRDHVLQVLHQAALGDFELDRAVRHAVGRHALVDVLDQVAAFEQARRQVDRDRIGKTEIDLPDLGLAGGLLQGPFAQRHDQPGFLGQRNEIARWHQRGAALPAHQRLGADHARRSHVDLGLVMQDQLVALDRLVQCRFKFELLAPAAGQHRAVDRAVVAARVLDRIHRDVGIAHQVNHRPAVARKHRNAHTGRDETLLAADENRLAHRFDDAHRDAFGIRLVGHFGQQRDELVAAQAAHRLQSAVAAHTGRFERGVHHLLGMAHTTAQPARHLDQQLITRGMAQRVVDDLEAVEVDQQQGGQVAQPAGVVERAFGAPDQLAAVGQAGQRVEVGQVTDAVLSDPAVGHVLHDAGVADAVAMLVELGLGLDVHDARTPVGQGDRHIDGQHRGLRLHLEQQPGQAAPLGQRHHAHQPAR